MCTASIDRSKPGRASERGSERFNAGHTGRASGPDLRHAVAVPAEQHDKTAPQSFTYALPDSILPVLNDDGSVVLFSAPETDDAVASVAGVVDAPWAKDASGAPVATHFEVDNGDLVQIVEHAQATLAYPVVADPKITAGITGTPYGPGAYINLTGAEMKAIAAAVVAIAGTGTVAICSGATKLPSPVARVAAVLCTAGGGVTVKAILQSIAKIYSNKKFASKSCYQTIIGRASKPFVKTARNNCS